MSGRSLSVSAKAHAWIEAGAKARGLAVRNLVETALAAKPWTVDGVASTSLAISNALCGVSNPRASRLLDADQLVALAAGRSTHVTLVQRVSLDVSLAVQEMVDDRCTRLRELHGVEMSRAELFDRAVNAALEASEKGWRPEL